MKLKQQKYINQSCLFIFLKDLVVLKLCYHEVCHPCLKKIVAANTSKELTNLDVTMTESFKCPKADCYTKLPIICVEAMNLALEGHLIAVSMRKTCFCSKWYFISFMFFVIGVADHNCVSVGHAAHCTIFEQITLRTTLLTMQ